MKTSKTSKTFKGSWIVRNLVLAVIIVIVLLIVLKVMLSVLGGHYRPVRTVPDFVNMTYDQAVALATDSLMVLVVDDSIYDLQMRRNGVFSQSPDPGTKVKQGRRIHVTVNSRAPYKVSMPSVVGLSMHQAKTLLVNSGLKLGRLIYVSDIATNNVMGQQIGGREVSPGVSLKCGTTVDLVVGRNSSDGSTYVPDLKGRSCGKAVDLINDECLNVGKVKYDRSVRGYADSLAAVVYSQTPEAGRLCPMGTTVSINLTVDESKIK